MVACKSNNENHLHQHNIGENMEDSKNKTANVLLNKIEN